MHRALAEQLYRTLLEQDEDRFAGSIRAESVWELPGRSALAGVHRGPAEILPVLRRLTELRLLRPDAYDVAASESHAVLMTRLVGDGLDSDHAFVVVAEDGRLARAFHYVFDLYAFDAHFARREQRC